MVITALIGYAPSGKIEIPSMITGVSLATSIAILANIAYIIFINIHKINNTNKYREILYTTTKLVILSAILIVLLGFSENIFEIENRRIFGCEFTNWKNLYAIENNMLIIILFMLLALLLYLTHKNHNITHVCVSLLVLIILIYSISKYQFSSIYNKQNNEIIVDSNMAIKNYDNTCIRLNDYCTIEYDQSTKTSTIKTLFNPYMIQGIINANSIDQAKSEQIKNLLASIGFPENIEFYDRTNASKTFIMNNLYCIVHNLFDIYKELVIIYTKAHHDMLIKNGFQEDNTNADMLMSIANINIKRINEYQKNRFNEKRINKWIIKENTAFEYMNNIAKKVSTNKITIGEFIEFMQIMNMCIEDYLAYHSVSMNQDKQPESITSRVQLSTNKTIEKLYQFDIIIEIQKLKFTII